MDDGFGTAAPVMQALREALWEASRPHWPKPRNPTAKRDSPPGRGAAKGRGRDAGRGGGRSASRSGPDWRVLGRQVMTLHEGYTSRREAFAGEANPIHEHLAGYQLYYLPRNFYRVWSVLESLPWRRAPVASLLRPWLREGAPRQGTQQGGSLPEGSPPEGAPPEEPTSGQPTLRLLDLGCGTGAFSLAWLAWLAARATEGETLPPVELTLVDQGHALLGLAQRNLKAFASRALPGLELRIEIHAEGMERFIETGTERAPYAVLGSAMVLNELGLLGPRRSARKSPRAVRYVEGLRRLLQPGGLGLLAEAGTRKGYMNLMAVRDGLKGAPLLYPCPHSLPCPMWDNKVRNWCHAVQPLPPGFFFDAELKARAGIGFEMAELNLSALAFQQPASNQPAFNQDRAEDARAPVGAPHAAQQAVPLAAPFMVVQGSRVVSQPLPARGAAGAKAPVPKKPSPKAAGRREVKSQPGRKDVAPPAAAETRPPRVVLECRPDGSLSEFPAQGLGRHTRGRWLPVRNERGG